ncbi:DUF4232 domain-containing protein [Kitasatospora aureofaciens]|uniref:DUF4232 domain-containing protein n=1 Tax=Kitasatospora aureofaciens TaxID=1894 RepID=UPI0033D1F6F2
MRVHKIAFAVLAVSAALSLTACRNDDMDPVQGAPSAAPTASTGTAPSGGPASHAPATSKPGKAGTPATAAPAGSGTAAKTAKCRTADLTITAADRTITGDPDNTVVVELKNHSDKDCTLSGYAGVDLKAPSGTLSADRTGQPAVTAVVAPGKSSYFGITYPANNTGGTGLRITGLVVTPPDETQPVTLPWPGAGSLPAMDTNGSPVKIGPMGSAGQGQ